MKHILTAAALTALAASAAQAAGDAAAGEQTFKQCQTCHVVQAEDGTLLAGKAGKTGPNLFGVAGRPAGSYPDFKYGDGMLEAGEKGLVWDEASFVAYVQDPTAFLKEFTGDPAARGKMTFKVKKPEDAANVYAFLAQFGGAAPAEGEATEAEPAEGEATN